MGQPSPLHPLRAWRESRRRTLAWCADKIGVTRQAWSDWERGRRTPNKTFMPKIKELTAGEVTADSFYPQLEKAA